MEQISEKEVLIMAVQLMSGILANPAMSEIRFKSCDSRARAFKTVHYDCQKRSNEYWICRGK